MTTQIAIRKPGRPCATCGHPRRRDIEAALLGSTVAAVAAEFGIAERNLYRHTAEHLPDQLRAQLRPAEAVKATDLLGIAGEVLQRSRAVAERAEERGEHLLIIRAGDATLRAATMLADRLGIRDTDSLELIDAAKSLVSAVGTISISHPEIGAAIVEQLRQQGAVEVADELTKAIQLNSRNINRKAAS